MVTSTAAAPTASFKGGRGFRGRDEREMRDEVEEEREKGPK